MNTFITSCPHCKTQLQVPTAGVGATISCPACSNSFTIMYPKKKSHKTSKPSGKLLIVISSIVVISLCAFATLAYIIESNRRLDKRVLRNMEIAANNGIAEAWSDKFHFCLCPDRPVRTWNIKSWVYRWWYHGFGECERCKKIYEKYK